MVYTKHKNILNGYKDDQYEKNDLQTCNHGSRHIRIFQISIATKFQNVIIYFPEALLNKKLLCLLCNCQLIKMFPNPCII